MEEKQTRLLTWFSVILLGLIALIVFVDPPEKKEEGAVSWERLWPDAERADTRGVELRRDGRALHFAREGERWTVREGDGPALRADARKVETLIDDVIEVETASDLAAESADAAEFGLAPPVAEVVVTVEDGSTLSLRVGRDTPVGYGTYVQKEEGGPVLRARARLSGSLNGGGVGALSDFRDKALVSFSASDVTGLVLRGPQALALREDASGWWLDTPVRARADEGKVEELLTALLDLRAEGFVADPGPEWSPEIAVDVVMGDRTETLAFGPDVDGRVARVPAHADAAMLGSALPEGLTRPAEEWLSGLLLPVRAPTLTKLDLKLGDKTLVAEKAEGAWSLPQAAPTLEAIEAARVDRRTPAEAPQGPPWGWIKLSEGTARAESLSLYQATADGGRVAQDDAGGAPFLLPAAEIQRLSSAMEELPAPSASDDVLPEMPLSLPESP